MQENNAVDLDTQEMILWGIPKGQTDALYAQVLYTQAKSDTDIERIKQIAARDGWHSFSVQFLGGVPNFSKGVK